MSVWTTVAIGVVVLFATSVAWTDEFKSWRVRIAKLIPSCPETPLQKARRERNERYEQYLAEYLTYGFDNYTAENKAALRMTANAKAVEGMKP